jgi:thiamine pyrophosphokinase
MRAIVVAGGDPPERAALDAAWPGWDRPCDLVVAADRGALAAVALGLRPDVVVGDIDSLGPAEADRLARAGIPFERVPAEKDETDTELALLVALRRGASDVVILGALGGPRLDHALANVALLDHPALAGTSAAILDARTRIRLLSAAGGTAGPASLALPGPVGGIVSLIPVGEAADAVTTDGLAYALSGATLPAGPARGVSNVRTAPVARVTLGSGRLLVIEIADGTGPTGPSGSGGAP